MLIGVAGRGWYQEEGKPAIEILPGTIIHIPANVKHWHGAAADSWFAHLAFEVPGEKTSNEWLEPVTDEEYDKLEQIRKLAGKRIALSATSGSSGISTSVSEARMTAVAAHCETRLGHGRQNIIYITIKERNIWK